MALSAEPALTGPARIELGLHVRDVERELRRTAVDDDAEPGSMRLAERRDPEQHAEAVAHRREVYDLRDGDAELHARAGARGVLGGAAAPPSQRQSEHDAGPSRATTHRRSSGSPRRRSVPGQRRVRERHLRGPRLRSRSSGHMHARAARLYARSAQLLRVRRPDVPSVRKLPWQEVYGARSVPLKPFAVVVPGELPLESL